MILIADNVILYAEHALGMMNIIVIHVLIQIMIFIYLELDVSPNVVKESI